MKQFEREIAAHIADVDQNCSREKSKQEIQQNDLAEARNRLLLTHERKKQKAAAQRELKQADYDLLKEGFKDPVVTKLKYMEVVGDLYQTINFAQLNLNHMSGDDMVANIIQTFSKMAD